MPTATIPMLSVSLRAFGLRLRLRFLRLCLRLLRLRLLRLRLANSFLQCAHVEPKCCVWNMFVVAFGRAFGLCVAFAFDLRVCVAFERLFNTLGAFGQCVCKRSVCVQTQARR